MTADNTARFRAFRSQRRLALALGLAALALGLALGNLPPCETEDSTWCAWDAQTQGNGAGQSFVNLGGWMIYAPADNLESF